MEVVNGKITRKCSLNDVKVGDIVLLGMDDNDDKITENSWYALAITDDCICEKISGYVDLETSEIYNDVENYPIFEIIDGSKVKIVLPE